MLGCVSTRAINYDALATQSSTGTPCFEVASGCLDPLALNFNCSVWRDRFTPCTESVPRPTLHVEYICNYQVAPPPAPLPHLPPGTTAPLYLTYEFVTEGEVRLGSGAGVGVGVGVRYLTYEFMTEGEAHSYKEVGGGRWEVGEVYVLVSVPP